MTTPETAEYLRLSVLTIYRYIKKYPTFPATRGQPFSSIAWNINRDKLDKWLETKSKLDIYKNK